MCDNLFYSSRKIFTPGIERVKLLLTLAINPPAFVKVGSGPKVLKTAGLQHKYEYTYK